MSDDDRSPANETPSAPPRDEVHRIKAGRVPLSIMLVLALVGVGAAVELTVVYHQANVDLGHESHCKLSAEWDCDNVARSEYATLASVPVALWGVIGYGFIAGFLAWALFGRGPRHWPLGILTLLVLGSVGMSAYLMYASFVVLQKKCMWCAVLYGVNGGLVVGLVAALASRRVGPVRAVRQDLAWLLDRLQVLGVLASVGLGVCAIALVWGPRLGQAERKPAPVEVQDLIKTPHPPAQREARRPGDARGGTPSRPLPPLPKGPPKWVGALVEPTTPGIGPKEADLYIVEFSDYECPFCQLSNREMEKVLAKYGKRIRLYHRHFPLDKSCFKQMKRQMHEHACFAAKAAICAHQQDKFWTFHDRLFRLGKSINRESIRSLATKLGLEKKTFEACLEAKSTAKQIQQDLQTAMALKVRGTPTFFMGGPLLDQFQPPGISVEMFDKLFQAVDKAKREYEAKRRASLGGKDAAASDPAAREPAAREPAAREPAAREPAAREPAAREPAAREPATRASGS